MLRAALSLPLALIAAATPLCAQVCDLVLMDTTAASGSLSRPTLLGNTAYVAAGTAGIAQFDVSDPANVVLTGTRATYGQAMDAVLDFFRYELAIADGSAGVSIYSVAGGGLPTPQATVSTGQTMVSVTGNSGLYVAGSQEGTLYTVTLGATSAAVEGSVTVGGQILGLVQHLNRVYCALGPAGVAIVDVSDRENPVVVATAELGGSVLSIAREGSTLWCGVDGVGLVTVVAEASALAPANSLSLDGAPTSLVEWGGRLYMAGPELGVAEADASLGTDVLVLAQLDLEGASGLAVAGDVLVVGRGTKGLSTVDGSDCASSGVFPTTTFVAAGARAVGAADTFWVTDLAVANLTGDAATFNVAYLAKDVENDSPINRSLVLGAGQQMLMADIFQTIFGLEQANGALRVTGSHPDVKVTSRTYNAAGAAGTYGQFIPSADRSAALEPGVAGAIIQLRENADFRTNIGLLNLTAITVETEIDLYLASGDVVGVRLETLLPHEMVQLNRIFDLVGAGTVDSGYAVVSVSTENGEVLAYASVVDNGSGDPIFIPAQKLTTGTPFLPP